MLQDYRELAEKLAEKFKTIDFWPDLDFNGQDIERIKEITDVEYVNRHSIQLSGENGNHVILPSQYILYAICIKELALDIKAYLDAFEEVKVGKSSNEIGEQISFETLDYSHLPIDEYSKSVAIQIFTDDSLNLGGKSIVNGIAGNYKIRGIVDYFGSIILKPINIPNASSTILGAFIYHLTENRSVYDYLEKRFLDQIPYIVKDNVKHSFARQVFSFLYQYDNLNAFQPLISKNATDHFRSIKFNEFSLTSIFRTSPTKLDPEEIVPGDRSRFYSEPLFMLNNEFYYFSKQWTYKEDKDLRLDLKTLSEFVNLFYSEFEVIVEENEFKLQCKILSETKSNNLTSAKNLIYYGAPGTGKSHKIESILKEIPASQKERITFHPEYDYSSFVGGYKPSSLDGDDIKYKFVPQVFTNIYVEAWKNPTQQYYLAIEEINRGNCAEIFGDLFQLLDRNSNYSISPSEELKAHLQKELANNEGIKEGKMKLPPNLHILASMNTSDQSLFPMDSAFKRRWSWEYIPINYEPNNADGSENISFTFTVRINEKQSFKWIDFINKVNLRIKGNANLGQDKCIGNYFIKPFENEISLNEFINKAVFYLWIDVFKDEDESIFSEIENNTSYEDFFPVNSNGLKNVVVLLKNLDVNLVEEEIPDQTEEVS